MRLGPHPIELVPTYGEYFRGILAASTGRALEGP